MTIEQARNWVLATALEQTQKFDAQEPPKAWRSLERERYEDCLEHGPEYKPSLWFGDLSNADRQQLLRAVEALERDGLVLRGRCWGRKFTHLRLTDLGRAAAASLVPCGGGEASSTDVVGAETEVRTLSDGASDRENL